ncbi:MAG: glutathione peroxidase [Bacteroidales bacterium]|nr:glutathione peroxidase [Bacteroidales bacterium]
MKTVITAILLSLAAFSYSQEDFYSFQVKDIDGKKFDFSSLKGKKVMIVNTASKCGFTYQYKALQELYDKYKDSSFVIIGFPANNFANQEPAKNKEIKEFCEKKFGVSFPMMEKISVKGDDMHPLYLWLTSKEKNGFEDSDVKWNFQKYLIDENGKLVAVHGTKTEPDDKAITDWIENK